MTRAINIGRWGWPSAILRYGLSALSVLAATIIQHFADMHFAVTPSFVCAVMISGWFGGMGSGLLATGLSILSLKYYFVPPTGRFTIDAEYIPSIILFTLIALLVTWLSARERKAAMSFVLASEALREAQMELAHVNRVMTMGQLAASIGHEVKQPLAAVITNASASLRWLARQPPDLEEARKALNNIIKDSNLANNIIGRICDLIRKAPLQKNSLEINEAILEVIALTRGEVVKLGVSVQTQLAEGLPLIQADRVQLQQVILNLIINAIEAMSGVRDGARELRISTGTDASSGVLVTVQDSGPGLPPESFDRVFEPFYTTKPDSGMGMGLSICRSIVQAHGGRIWASRTPGTGATLQFALPVG